jgi:hypothetical protein
MAAQTAISAFQKTTELKLIANENWKKKLKLITTKPQHNVTSNIAHQIT